MRGNLMKHRLRHVDLDQEKRDAGPLDCRPVPCCAYKMLGDSHGLSLSQGMSRTMDAKVYAISRCSVHAVTWLLLVREWHDERHPVVAGWPT